MEKTLSIAVPSYNVERYLADSLASYCAGEIDDRLEVLEAVGLQDRLNLRIRARHDLVDHRPGVGDLPGFGHVSVEFRRNEAQIAPLLRIGEDTGLHLVAVMGAVVHALQRERKLAGLETLIKKRGQLSHGKHGAEAARKVRVIEAVALFGDREADHLKRRLSENLAESCPVLREGGVGLQ